MSLASSVVAAAFLPLAASVPPVARVLEGGEKAVTYAGGIVHTETPAVVTPASMTHGPFTGTPTVTGALTGPTVLGTALTPHGPPPAATTYPSDGNLHDAMPAPYVPGGGLGTNGTIPSYLVQSDYDFQSVVCGLDLLASVCFCSE